MMLYCHFQIKNMDEVDFTFDWKIELGKTFPNLIILEADNHSDPFLIQECSKLIEKSKQVICLFDVEEGCSPGSISRILEAIRKSEAHKLLLLKGRNESIEKALKFVKTPWVKFQSSQELLFEIQEFLSP